MNSGLFGPRGPSNSYYSSNYSHSYGSPYTNSYQNQTAYPYRPGFLSPSYNQYRANYPYCGQFQNTLPTHTPYTWESPKVILPSGGLESILIAILVLVALDMVFIRPTKSK